MKKTLTTTAVIAGYFALMITLGIVAAVPGSVHKSAKETVQREIIRNIACPEFITQNNEANQVKAIVAVDENGKVNIEEINSANTQLRDYVVAQLQDLKVAGDGHNEKFVLVVKFKVD